MNQPAPPGRGIKRSVLQYLMDHPGNQTVERIAEDMGIGRQQVAQAVHGLKREDGSQVVSPMNGVYRYDPDPFTAPVTVPAIPPGSIQISRTPEPEPRPAPKARGHRRPKPGDVYECVGTDSNGTALVRSEAGTIYKLTEV